MISFHVPLTKKEEGGNEKEFFSFALKQDSTVLFAGSRHQEISSHVCHDLVSGFGRLGFSFIIGCAKGVDASFRQALAESDYSSRSFVACAYAYRINKIRGLPIEFIVPDDVHPKQAPRVRTLWMVDHCDMAVVFPDDITTGLWGKGSTVCINACIKQGKPVFVVTSHRPDDIDKCHVLPTSLFGAVRGYFIVKKRAGRFTRSDSLKTKACPTIKAKPCGREVA